MNEHIETILKGPMLIKKPVSSNVPKGTALNKVETELKKL